MKSETYTPRQNGVEGIDDFGAIEHGTNYDHASTVSCDGVKLVGRCSEPLLVAKFLAERGIEPIFTASRVFDSRNPYGRVEVSPGLPFEMRGPTKVAKGAHAFIPDWDAGRRHRLPCDEVYKTEHGYSQGTHGVQHYNPLEGLFD